MKNAKLPPVAWTPHSMTCPAATGARQGVVVGSRPAEVGGCRADDDRGIGDAPRDDDVGSGVQAIDDAPRAEVGVGREGCAEAQLSGASYQVIALDVGDVDVEPEPLGQVPHCGGESRGVEAARVADDLDAAFEGKTHALLELRQEGLGVAAVGRLGAVTGQDQHRQFGEVVAGDVVDLATGDHLAHRGMAVAVEARAVGDAHCLRHAFSLGVSGTGVRPVAVAILNQPVGR